MSEVSQEGRVEGFPDGGTACAKALSDAVWKAVTRAQRKAFGIYCPDSQRPTGLFRAQVSALLNP